MKVKEFFKKIWEGIKNIFLGFKVVSVKEEKSYFNDKVKIEKGKIIVDINFLDVNKDGDIQLSEIVDTLKQVNKEQK